jgi:hypothetical protein
MSLYQKYLKYKNKYFELKNQIGGSDAKLLQERNQIWLENSQRIQNSNLPILPGIDSNIQNLLEAWKDMINGKWNFNFYKIFLDSLPKDLLEDKNFMAGLEYEIIRANRLQLESYNEQIGNQIKEYIKLKIQKGGYDDDFKVGDRVIERDSGMRGTIIEIHFKYNYMHAIMKGDDGRIYDHNFSHYTKIY